MKFLITDDLYTNRLQIKILLQSMGIEYDQANDGKQAIEKLKENQYDLILMDIEMPVMNGLEATRYIRENFNRSKSNVKIIAITSHDPHDFESNFVKYGFNGFLSKPITRQKVEKIMTNDSKTESLFKF